MDFDLDYTRTDSRSPTNLDAEELARHADLIKREISAVQERIAGLKAISGNTDFLSIPTSYVSNPAPVIVVDTDRHLREASPAFAHMVALDAQALAFGSDALGLFVEGSRARLTAELARLSQTGVIEPFESELIGPGGKALPVMVAMSKIGPTDSECFIFFLDMSAHKALQKELAIKQSNLATLAEAIPQLIWVSTARGQVSYANEHFRIFTGADVDSGNINWKDFLAAPDRQNFPEENFSPDENYADFQAEVRLRRYDGLHIWHLLKVVPFFNTAGDAMHWLVIATEIDDQKRLTDSLLVAEEQLRVIADAMPQIVWTANARGTVDFLNHRWFEYTGLTGEQSLHGGWRLLMHSEDLPEYEERWRQAVLKAEPFEVEFRLKRVLGLGGRRSSVSAFKAKTSSTKTEQRRDYLWHLCRAVPLKTAQGLVVRWFGTWTEIDEHKARN